MKKAVKDTACLICGNTREVAGIYNDYKAFKCMHCGLISVDRFPDKDEIRKFYSAKYFKNYYSGLGYENAYKKILRQSFRRKIRLIKKIAGSKEIKILEVGCGPGYFIKSLRDAGFNNVTGYEISDEAISAAARIGVTLQKKDITVKENDQEQYDLVISWATVEHTPNPAEYFRSLIGYLRPGGHLMIDTGIADTFFDRIFRGLTPWFYPPEHLYVFTKKALLLLAAGFNQKKVIINPQFSITQRSLRALILLKRYIINRHVNPVQDIGLLIMKNDGKFE